MFLKCDIVCLLNRSTFQLARTFFGWYFSTKFWTSTHLTHISFLCNPWLALKMHKSTRQYDEYVGVLLFMSYLETGAVSTSVSLQERGAKWRTNEGWNISSYWVAPWLIEVLASVTSSDKAPSAETIFSHQNMMSTVFDELWSQWVPRYDCLLLWIVF